MANILLSYTIIDRDNDSKKIPELIDQYFIETGYSYKEGYYALGEDKVKFDLKHKPKTNRYYLELFLSARYNKAIEIMQRFDDCLFKTDFGKYAYVYRDYDGVSAIISEKLFPLYSKYERGLRRMVLLVLIKSFGADSVRETINSDQMKKIMEVSSGNASKNDLSELLEYFDLRQLESFLFSPQVIDVLAYLSDDLSEENLINMSKEDICKCIDKMRPKSLWEKEFNEIGSQEEWENLIKQVHNCRNKVAHHRRIRVEEYKDTNKQLRLLIKKIEDAISELYAKEFSLANSTSVLSGFGYALSNLSDVLNAFYDKSDVINGISKTIHYFMKSLTDYFASENLDIWKGITSNMAEIPQNSVLLGRNSDEWNKMCETIASTIDSNKLIKEYSRINQEKLEEDDSIGDIVGGIGDNQKDGLIDDE